MMIAKVSDLAAQILIEGWYQGELEDSKLAVDHFPPELGDTIDLDCGYLIRKADGWYISHETPENIVRARYVLETV